MNMDKENNLAPFCAVFNALNHSGMSHAFTRATIEAAPVYPDLWTGQDGRDFVGAWMAQ